MTNTQTLPQLSNPGPAEGTAAAEAPPVKVKKVDEVAAEIINSQGKLFAKDIDLLLNPKKVEPEVAIQFDTKLQAKAHDELKNIATGAAQVAKPAMSETQF